jgi:N-acetylglucosaminyldiphosphoundecaprenol N-acetyl-beta-D-mannosaminyltransferase
VTRANVLGVGVDRLTTDETVARCEQAIDERRLIQHVCVNAAKVVALRHDDRLRRIVEECEIVSADGQPVVWASRLLGDPLPERVNGTELMYRLFALAEKRGFGVFILGARQEVLDRAVATLRADYPGLRIAGARNGWFPDEEGAEVAREIAAAKPDILFVAISSPRKEYFLAEHGRTLEVPLIMGVGGSIDIVAGVTRRAPRWMRSAGLEWLFRLVQEPRRLAHRYFVTNTQFIGLVGKETVRRRLRRA